MRPKTLDASKTPQVANFGGFWEPKWSHVGTKINFLSENARSLPLLEIIFFYKVRSPGAKNIKHRSKINSKLKSRWKGFWTSFFLSFLFAFSCPKRSKDRPRTFPRTFPRHPKTTLRHAKIDQNRTQSLSRDV